MLWGRGGRMRVGADGHLEQFIGSWFLQPLFYAEKQSAKEQWHKIEYSISKGSLQKDCFQKLKLAKSVKKIPKTTARYCHQKKWGFPLTFLIYIHFYVIFQAFSCKISNHCCSYLIGMTYSLSSIKPIERHDVSLPNSWPYFSLILNTYTLQRAESG